MPSTLFWPGKGTLPALPIFARLPERIVGLMLLLIISSTFGTGSSVIRVLSESRRMAAETCFGSDSLFN